MISRTTHHDVYKDHVCIIGNCQADAVKEFRAPLCERHAKTVAAAVCYYYGVHEGQRAPRPAPKSGTTGMIYIVRLGDTVKIGFSRNPETRLLQIPHEEIIAMFPGTFKTERALHERFAHLRVTGEWFRSTPDLLAFTRALEAASMMRAQEDNQP